MNAKCGSVHKPLLFLSFLFLLHSIPSFGQTPALVLEPVDNALPMNRILLLLKRSGAQEAALQTYMEQQLFFALGCGGCGGSTAGGGGGGGGGGGSPQPTTITLATTNAKVPEGSAFTVTATVTGTNSPTGTVIFYAGGTPIGGVITLTNGQAK
jgi:hypothetical protein